MNIYRLKDFTKIVLWTSFLLSLSLFFTANIYAQDQLPGQFNDTSKFVRDASTNFLTILFGNVSAVYNNILVGGTDSLLSVVFRYFNGVCAVVGAALVSYITIISLANSAHSGTPMGQKWHSLFLPLRVSFGAGMLIPNAFGYNIAQVLTMWFILSGVQGADTVWNKMVDRLMFDGDAAVSGFEGVSTDANPSVGEILDKGFNDSTQFAACLGFITPSSGDTRGISIDCYPNADNCGTSTSIRAYANGNYISECGELKYNSTLVSLDEANKALFVQSFIDTYLKTAMMETAPLSKYIKRDCDKSGICSYNVDPRLSDFDKQNFTIETKLAVSDISMLLLNNWRLLLADSIQYLGNQSANANDDAQKIKAAGWFSAGSSYYYLIAAGNKNNVGNKSADETIDAVYGLPLFRLSNLNVIDPVLIDNQDLVELIQSLQPNAASANSFSYPLKLDLNYNAPDKFGIGSYTVGKIVNKFIYLVPKLINMVINKILNPKELFGYNEEVDVTDINSIRENIKTDPLASVAKKGNDIATWCETFFGTVISVLIALFVASAITPGLPYFASFYAIAGPAVVGALFAIFAVITVFYPVAIIMNVYVPLIPFFIYTFGVIGWLMLCIEAMAAAPIVALGLMHPQGDEVLGQAEAGLKLLLNLMLRPVLMIAGLAGGIVLVRLILLFFSWTLMMTLGSGLLIVNNSVGAIAALTIIYVAMISVIAHKSFDLINKIPDKVMTWIGAPGSSIGESGEILQKAESSGKEGAGMPFKTFKSGAGGAEAGHAMGSATNKTGAGLLKK